MSPRARYWLAMAYAWVGTRVVTGSPIAATVASAVTCWLIVSDEKRDLKIELSSSQNSAPNAEKTP